MSVHKDDWTFHLQTVTRPIANKCVSEGSNASRALSGSAKRENVGIFSIIASWLKL